MPPKAKYTSGEILNVAFEMTRKHGTEILTARGLAAELGTSTAPIFSAFTGIDEIRAKVRKHAWNLYMKYFNEGLNHPIPFKGTGIKFIQFAKDEPELFKMLFMDNNDDGGINPFMAGGDPTTPAVLDIMDKQYSFSADKAKRIYNHLSVFCYGLAVLFAQRRCIYTMQDTDRMLSEVFLALAKED